jgi:hypothetical protein
MVNGRTGEVQGERPYSWIKIALAILAFVLLVCLILFVTQGKKMSMSEWEYTRFAFTTFQWDVGVWFGFS